MQRRQMVGSSVLQRIQKGSLAVAAGPVHTCAVRADGRLICFADSLYEQSDVDNR